MRLRDGIGLALGFQKDRIEGKEEMWYAGVGRHWKHWGSFRTTLQTAISCRYVGQVH